MNRTPHSIDRLSIAARPVLSVAAAAPSAMATRSSGKSLVAPRDGRSPDTRGAAWLARRSMLVLVDGRSPDTVDAAIAVRRSAGARGRTPAGYEGRGPRADERRLAPVDGCPPDTIDAAIEAHALPGGTSPWRRFNRGDLGIGLGAAFGAMLMLVALRTGWWGAEGGRGQA